MDFELSLKFGGNSQTKKVAPKPYYLTREPQLNIGLPWHQRRWVQPGYPVSAFSEFEDSKKMKQKELKGEQ